MTNYGDATVSILLGVGSGMFHARANFTVGLYPRTIVSDDFDGDGKSDLAVISAGDNSINIMVGNGDGSFQTPSKFGTGDVPLFMTMGDLNNDQRPDLVVTNRYALSLSVLLNVCHKY